MGGGSAGGSEMRSAALHFSEKGRWDRGFAFSSGTGLPLRSAAAILVQQPRESGKVAEFPGWGMLWRFLTSPWIVNSCLAWDQPRQPWHVKVNAFGARVLSATSPAGQIGAEERLAAAGRQLGIMIGSVGRAVAPPVSSAESHRRK